jgi:hypothetical protein
MASLDPNKKISTSISKSLIPKEEPTAFGPTAKSGAAGTMVVESLATGADAKVSLVKARTKSVKSGRVSTGNSIPPDALTQEPTRRRPMSFGSGNSSAQEKPPTLTQKPQRPRPTTIGYKPSAEKSSSIVEQPQRPVISQQPSKRRPLSTGDRISSKQSSHVEGQAEPAVLSEQPRRRRPTTIGYKPSIDQISNTKPQAESGKALSRAETPPSIAVKSKPHGFEEITTEAHEKPARGLNFAPMAPIVSWLNQQSDLIPEDTHRKRNAPLPPAPPSTPVEGYSPADVVVFPIRPPSLPALPDRSVEEKRAITVLTSETLSASKEEKTVVRVSEPSPKEVSQQITRRGPSPKLKELSASIAKATIEVHRTQTTSIPVPVRIRPSSFSPAHGALQAEEPSTNRVVPRIRPSSMRPSCLYPSSNTTSSTSTRIAATKTATVRSPPRRNSRPTSIAVPRRADQSTAQASNSVAQNVASPQGTEPDSPYRRVGERLRQSRLRAQHAACGAGTNLQRQSGAPAQAHGADRPAEPMLPDTEVTVGCPHARVQMPVRDSQCRLQITPPEENEIKDAEPQTPQREAAGFADHRTRNDNGGSNQLSTAAQRSSLAQYVESYNKGHDRHDSMSTVISWLPRDRRMRHECIEGMLPNSRAPARKLTVLEMEHRANEEGQKTAGNFWTPSESAGSAASTVTNLTFGQNTASLEAPSTDRSWRERTASSFMGFDSPAYWEHGSDFLDAPSTEPGSGASSQVPSAAADVRRTAEPSGSNRSTISRRSTRYSRAAPPLPLTGIIESHAPHSSRLASSRGASGRIRPVCVPIPGRRLGGTTGRRPPGGR